jgi:hypothetical protein
MYKPARSTSRWTVVMSYPSGWSWVAQAGTLQAGRGWAGTQGQGDRTPAAGRGGGHGDKYVYLRMVGRGDAAGVRG